MNYAAFVTGVIAVILYLLGYQQKKRKNIILFNATSRALYIVQYILLSAFEGAVLDVAGIISSVLAQKKDTPFIKKHIKAFIIVINLLIVCSGLLIYKNIFSLLPVLGVLFHTIAFWINDEKIIRRVSLLGCPFWLAYNIISGAYGSCIGDILSIVSLLTAMMRYDFFKTTLLLIRHGESEANRSAYFAGQLDAELMEKGVEQATLSAEFVKENYKVSAIYSSDLQRAYRTAECFSEILGLDIIKEEGLREINGGDFQGKKHAELPELYPEEYGTIWLNHIGKAKCPNGETVRELGERVITTLEKIAKKNKGKTILISTHATPIRATQCIVETGSVDQMENTPWASNASVTEITYNNGKWELVRASIDDHLKDLKTAFSKYV